MDEEGEVGEVSEETVAAAREMGWAPLNEFKGDPANWIDADAYVERGKAIMPIMRANNERLLKEVADLKSLITVKDGESTKLRETVEALKEFQEESARQQYARARASLLNDKKLAKKEGDVDAEVEIDEALVQLEERKPKDKKDEEPASKPPATAPRFVDQPWYITWAKKNPWVDSDPVKSATALGVARKLVSEGAQPGPEFLEKVSAEVDRIFNPSSRSNGDRVEGSRGGAGGGGGGNGRSYSDLPADAKAACDRFAQRLVGEGRAWKTVAEYQKHYAKQYFTE